MRRKECGCEEEAPEVGRTERQKTGRQESHSTHLPSMESRLKLIRVNNTTF